MKNAKDNSNLKVVSGQPLKAELWNRVIDRLPNNDAGAGTSVSLINKVVVQCKAHQDIDTMEVWAVDAFLGDDDLYEIAPSHVLSVTEVVWPELCHKLVVAERPVLQNEIGPFAYNGGAIVELAAGVGDYAFPDPDNPQGMKRGSSGYRILNLVGSDKAVVHLGDVQQLWLYKLTETYTGGSTGTGHIHTLYDAQFSSSPTTINFEMDCKPESLAVGHTGYCMFADGAFWAIDNCATGGGGGQAKLVRFVLENKFNDTGQALANVLDTFGNTGLTRGDQVVVNDPRKLFAHAIGYTNMNFTPAAVSDFPCGGSIGYAIWTEDPNTDPPSTGDYPRYEVEQCTQTVERMKVYVYESGSSGSGSAKSRPTGQMPTSDDGCWLYFNDATSFASRWPNTDYCESWEDVTDPEIAAIYKYKVFATNPHRFSAKRGSWCIIEKNTTPQRPEDACNDVTPYFGSGDAPPQWVISEVELPLARWIAVTFDTATAGQDKWNYGSEFAEGEDPSFAYFPDGVELNDRIITAPNLSTGCLTQGEPGWAFWDPNEQMYNVISTNSSLYGTAVEVKAVASTEMADNLLSASDCTITYKELKTFSAFGIKEGADPDDCSPEITNNSISIGTHPVNVVTGFTYDPEHPYLYCPTTAVVYVCGTAAGQPEPCIDVCTPCEDPPPLTGCCENYDGTYTPDQTQADCEGAGGTYLGDGSACPDPCVACDICENCDGVILSPSTIKTGQGADPNFAESLFVSDGCEMSANCQVTCTGVWTSPGLPDVAGTVTWELKQDAEGECYLEQTASPATVNGFEVDGWKLLSSGMTNCCDEGFGSSFGQGLEPLNGQDPATEIWDECNVTATCCFIGGTP